MPSIVDIGINQRMTEYRKSTDFDPRRRFCLRTLTYAAGLGLCPAAMTRAAVTAAIEKHGAMIKPSVALQAADANGWSLWPDFQSRIIARSGQPVVPGGDNQLSHFLWHAAPDGGATFADAAAGWGYISNSELDHGRGGVSVIRFSADGQPLESYSILRGTNRNCAGSMTPWQTYLSCEEVPAGRVWECDPYGQQAAVARPMLGRFLHESLAIDPDSYQIYLTEDHQQGCFYRFTPAAVSNGVADLSRGRLEVAQVLTATSPYQVIWHPLPRPLADPAAGQQATRLQVKAATRFSGGEGICVDQGHIYFVTKGKHRVWDYHIATQTLRLLYQRGVTSSLLTGPDNIIVSPWGLLVSEDGGDMQLVTLNHEGQVTVFAQLHGHERSELTGLAMSPDGRRLYVSSQRGQSGQADAGIVFEISRKMNNE